MDPWLSLGIQKMERKKSGIFKRAKQEGKTVWKNEEDDRRGPSCREEESQCISSWKMVFLHCVYCIIASKILAYKCNKSSVNAWCVCNWKTMECLGSDPSFPMEIKSNSENKLCSSLQFINLVVFLPRKILTKPRQTYSKWKKSLSSIVSDMIIFMLHC